MRREGSGSSPEWVRDLRRGLGLAVCFDLRCILRLGLRRPMLKYNGLRVSQWRILDVWSATKKVPAENEFGLIVSAHPGLDLDRTP